jgi:glycosyltransferase involved in cell wall biosynthesis
MRILHVTPYYRDAWAYGGIPRVVPILAEHFAALGHDVTVCTTDAYTADERLSASARTTAQSCNPPQGVRLRVFPNLSNRLAYHLQMFLPVGLSTYLRAHARQFDIVHIHACHNVPGVMAARACRRASVPYVVSPHGTAPRIERRLLAKYIFDITLGRGFLRNAACLLAVTEAERRQLHALDAATERIAVVSNPLNESEFTHLPPRGAFRARYGLRDDPVVLYLGKLTPRKRLDVLAKAFAMLPHQRARLVIAGNDMGYLRRLNELLVSLGLHQRTVITGLLRGDDRLAALVDADVLVYPAQDEIFGLVPLEAILCGTPAIVADDSGCAEVVTQVGGGVVTPLADASALARAIQDVLDHLPGWNERVADAKRRIAALFSAATVGAQIEAAYRQAIRYSADRHSAER